MMNTKKSRRGMVALSVLAALIICSFATIYAFAANAATPTNSIPSYSESPETFPYIHSINEAKSNVLAYMNDNGEMMYSDDGGKTWVTEENFDFGKYINTPEVPDLETWTYDEVKAWIENSKAELQLQKSLGEITQEQLDDIFEMYDNWLICIKRYLVIGDNGSSTWLTKEEFDKAYPAPELEFWTYDEYKTWIDEQKIELHKKIGEIPGWTQETVDGIIRYYGDNLEVIKGGDVKISKNGRSDISSYACTVRHTLPDGEEISMGFAAFSSGELYKLVKTYLDGQVEAGKMTQTEADGLLAGLTQDSTRLTFDSEGNRVK
ncbi:MAG: hypothetical protein FWG34_14710, partial [Oscillospiraceae bacterium]|nr:hypothetical protein [Oscillospiraceae bacterium]